jgi:hypothetical protein
MMKKLLAPAFVLALAGLAQAQAGGGFGPGMRDRERIPWFNSIEKAGSGTDNLSQMEKRRLKAMGIEPTDKKYIFVYIRPVTEETEPREFANCTDALEGARGPWAFVKVDFDKENSYQKAWGIKGAPACVGCDLYANDFVKVGGPSIDNIRTIIRTTPELVAKYDAKLKYDFQKANEAVKTDEEKGSKLFVDICLTGKNGYKEVAESQSKLNELTDSAFRKGELATAVSPESGVEYFEDLVKIYRTTAPGAKAEIALAILDHARGNIAPAIQRLLKVLKYDARLLKPEVEAAAKALDEISKAGDAKIEAALSGPDKAVTKEVLRKLAKDYAGTDAGKHAADASK